MHEPDHHNRQDGFVLIVALILLTTVSLLVLAGMRGSLLGERMAGNYMDRNLAKLAAEQALTQGLAKLQANSTTCFDTGCTSANVAGTGAALTATVLPSAWSDTNSVAVTVTSSQASSASYLINWLNNTTFTPTGSGRSLCKAYSVMGKGVGKNTASVVVLQTVAYVCPTD